MNSPLHTGMFGAWAAVQFALGGFFILAYAARRQDVEYLLFGLLCFALAVFDAGLALTYRATSLSEWPVATLIGNSGAVVATALNSHFVLAYANRRPSMLASLAIDCLALFFTAVNLSGSWYRMDTLRVEAMNHFGIPVGQIVAIPTLFGAAFYVILLVSQLALLAVLVQAHRAGRYGALRLLVGLSIVIAFAANDTFAASGILGTPFLTPFGFLMYGFVVASTLLGRYRRAAEELEATAGELRQATDELTSSYLELSDVQEELFRRKQLASVGELAAAIAHEVRNPLAVIRNAAANLKRPKLTPEDRNTLFEIIEEEIKHLNGLVTELVRFARPVNIERSDVALSEALSAVVSSLSTGHKVDVRLASDPQVESVWADPALLRLAIENILANACQAAPEERRIVVSASRETEAGLQRVRIDVIDEGPGMDTETLARALDPFFTTRPKGTGLGLPIAQRIVEAHDGELAIESRPGGGTTVSIWLPCRRDVLQTPEIRSDEMGRHDSEEAPASGPRQRSSA